MALSSNVSTAIQQIFVGLLGRPVAKAGLDYWTEQVNNGFGLEEVMANIVNEQPEYLEAFGDLDRAEAVTLHFQQLFGREPTLDAAGGNYWINGEGADVPVNELVLALINGAQGNDIVALNNRVIVADAYTRTAAENGAFDVDAAKDVVGGVDHTNASVAAALSKIDGATFNVAAAMADYEAAQSALGEFLASLDLDGDGEPDFPDADTDPAQATAADAALDDALTTVGTAVGYDPTKSAAWNEANIAMGVADLEQDLDAVQGLQVELAGLLRAFNTANPGASAAVNKQLNAAAAVQNASRAETAREADLNGAQAFTQTATGATVAIPAAPADLVLNDGSGTNLVLATFDTATGSYKLASGSEVAAVPGVQALVTSLNAYNTAVADVADKQAVLAAATADVAGFAGDPDADGDYSGIATIDTLADLANEMAAQAVAERTAQEALDEYNEAVASLAGLQALVEQRDNLEQDVDDAMDAIEEIGSFTIETLNDTSNEFGTTGNDLYFLELAAGESAEIDDFGLVGNDVIYVGTAYELNGGRLTQGDDAQLEVFFLQGTTAADTLVHVETKAYGSDSADFFTIELVGVTASELTFADGFIALA